MMIYEEHALYHHLVYVVSEDVVHRARGYRRVIDCAVFGIWEKSKSHFPSLIENQRGAHHQSPILSLSLNQSRAPAFKCGN